MLVVIGTCVKYIKIQTFDLITLKNLKIEAQKQDFPPFGVRAVR